MNFAVSCSTIIKTLVLMASTVNAQCSDVQVVFARGSGEIPGLGICGTPFVRSLTSTLYGMSVSSYAVSYLALASQASAGPGASDMSKHVMQMAQQCPNTVFVLGGYSQGASVVDIAIGINTMLGKGTAIPEHLAPRIKAIVTFGNPLRLTGLTITRASALYGSKAIEFCNFGDPVCGNGANALAHTLYPSDGSVMKAASQAAALVKN
uniref:Cutinase n=1 Tax=Peronospora matthiolae TaxID=2874970 RepID=A0AAV1USN9_9STRA